MPPHFAEAFVRVVPELDSWFLVKLRLTEVTDIAPGVTVGSIDRGDSATRLNPAGLRRLAGHYVQRLERGQQQGLPAAELEETLLLPAITLLQQGGLNAEAADLQRRFGGKPGHADAGGQESGDLAPAETALQRAESLRRRGRKLHDGLQFREAESLYRDALTRLETAAPDSPLLASVLSDLAQLLHVTHRLAEAEPLMRRALQIFIASLGADHPHSRGAQGNYVGLLQALGRTQNEIADALASLPIPG